MVPFPAVIALAVIIAADRKASPNGGVPKTSRDVSTKTEPSPPPVTSAAKGGPSNFA